MNLFGEHIRSYEFQESMILKNIAELHCNGNIELDATYSRGEIYKETSIDPKHKFDINPQSKDCFKSAAQVLPLAKSSIKSSILDPPFLWGKQCGKMGKRFSHYETYEQLKKSYTLMLIEQFRILDGGGILIFKCQDLCTGRQQFFIHIDVFNFAKDAGFIVDDLFIKLTKNVLINKNQTQRYARKHHCYYWVFRKPKKRGHRVKKDGLK